MSISAIELFGGYMRLVGVPVLSHNETSDTKLSGKSLGLVNGGAWIQLWSYYFGRKHAPGVKLVNIGNEAIQLNFMQTHHDGKPVPPQRNIELFADYALQLVELAGVDVVLVTCSTMNRSFSAVADALSERGVPALQIDAPMMEAAVRREGRVLVVATHGPTVENTAKLLRETAHRLEAGHRLEYVGVTVEDAFKALGAGDVEKHNAIVAGAIREATAKTRIDTVVLAQLSMSVFSLSSPDSIAEFGVPVLTSGDEGFKRAADLLRTV